MYDSFCQCCFATVRCTAGYRCLFIHAAMCYSILVLFKLMFVIFHRVVFFLLFLHKFRTMSRAEQERGNETEINRDRVKYTTDKYLHYRMLSKRLNFSPSLNCTNSIALKWHHLKPRWKYTQLNIHNIYTWNKFAKFNDNTKNIVSIWLIHAKRDVKREVRWFHWNFVRYCFALLSQ